MTFSDLTIIQYPDARLRKPCARVERFDDDLAKLAARMIELMREKEGIGLAGPQVGAMIRLFVCNVTGDPKDDQVYLNPVLTQLEGESEGEEGCLSIPDVTVTMRRAARCRMTAFDLQGQPVEREGADLLARCWQHECDHLDGRLIIDRMSEAERIANRKALKRLESEHRKRACGAPAL